MHNAVTSYVTGIKCDAEGCVYRDDSVTLESYANWLNRPCPNCGANLLTQTDFDTVQHLMKVAEVVNKIVGPLEGDASEDLAIIKYDMNGCGISKVTIDNLQPEKEGK